MNDAERNALIKQMVDKFLGWPIPKDFMPDAGIAFTQPRHPLHWPIGTNLFDAEQARQMFEHCLPVAREVSE